MKKIKLKDGIKFQCQSSGNCCVSRGSYGFVYLSKKDITRFAKYFKISITEFKLKYCQITDGYIHLTEKKSFKGKCIFLKQKKCSVYKSRPSQCRTWPFWNENMNTKTWNEDIAINCPGIGKGKKIKLDIINRFLKEDYENESSILDDAINLQK
tara:strand:- start:18027 stop:18488 length:462 start_codon:yes stop_codon:yes gene_type:complete